MVEDLELNAKNRNSVKGRNEDENGK